MVGGVIEGPHGGQSITQKKEGGLKATLFYHD
jgi:hypothetical protein